MPEFVLPTGTRVECSEDLARVLGWVLPDPVVKPSESVPDAPEAEPVPTKPKRGPGRPRKVVKPE